VDQRRRKIEQLFDQVRPIAGDGVTRVMAEHLQRLDLKVASPQFVKQDPVSTGREAVRVRENQ
jgi:hypothetical protein